MNNSIKSSVSSESHAFCTSITAKGRRCRYPVHKPGSHLCKLHSRPRRVQLAEPEANPLAGLSPEISAFHSYADITQFLARVLTLLSENRISPRRAAVLSYIANSLLNSLRATERLAQYEAAHAPEEEFHMDFSHMSAPLPEPSQPSPAPSAACDDVSTAPHALAEARSSADPSHTLPLPQPHSASLQHGSHRENSDSSSVPPASALGGPLPQPPATPSEPYNYSKDPKYFRNRRN